MVTQIGRISVITLILPILNYLVLTFPNPGSDFIKTLNKEIYHFFRGNKILKVKKYNIRQECRYDGLK